MDSRVIGVVIGLTTIYLFYSLAVSQLNEVIQGLLSSRAKHLAAGIKDKLLDPVVGQQVIDHPIIKSMGFTKNSMPSYIPAASFARALVDIIAKDPKAVGNTLAEKLANSSLPKGVKEKLAAVVSRSATTAAEAEERIALWYDDTMERMSGSYKRHTQLWSFLIGGTLVLASNADSIRLTSKFWNDSVVRAAETQAAQKWAADCTRGPDGGVVCPEIMTSEMPIKWTKSEFKGLNDGADWFWFMLAKLIGLFATTLAVSLGAPFWFDLLQKVAPGLRMSGKPPQTMREQMAQPGAASGSATTTTTTTNVAVVTPSAEAEEVALEAKVVKPPPTATGG